MLSRARPGFDARQFRARSVEIGDIAPTQGGRNPPPRFSTAQSVQMPKPSRPHLCDRVVPSFQPCGFPRSQALACGPNGHSSMSSVGRGDMRSARRVICNCSRRICWSSRNAQKRESAIHAKRAPSAMLGVRARSVRPMTPASTAPGAWPGRCTPQVGPPDPKMCSAVATPTSLDALEALAVGARLRVPPGGHRGAAGPRLGAVVPPELRAALHRGGELPLHLARGRARRLELPAAARAARRGGVVAVCGEGVEAAPRGVPPLGAEGILQTKNEESNAADE